MLPILEQEIILRRGWATSDELLNYYAVSQVTPGAIAINIASFIGYKKGKILGVVVASLALITPAVVTIILFASLLFSHGDSPLVGKIIHGVNSAVVAMLFTSVHKLLSHSAQTPVAFTITALSFVLLQYTPIPTTAIIAGSGLLGIFLYPYTTPRHSPTKGEQQ